MVCSMINNMNSKMPIQMDVRKRLEGILQNSGYKKERVP